jgi:hypothetical protein
MADQRVYRRQEPDMGIGPFFLFFFLVLVVGFVVVVARGAARRSAAPSTGSTGGPSGSAASARRVVVFALLFALVVIAAVGVSGLLGRLLDPTSAPAGSDTGELAQSLAFTLIGGPLALVLWWWQWRRIDDLQERASTAWSLYVAGMSTLALLVSASTLMAAATQSLVGEKATGELATGLVWAGVWVWHHSMAVHATKSPTQLTDLAPVAGAAYGVLACSGGTTTALAAVVSAGLDATTGTVAFGTPWWRLALQGLVWAIGGLAVWWVHWVRWRAREVRTALGDVAVVTVGVFGAALATLGGAGTTMYCLLRLAFDRVDPVRVILDPVPVAGSLAVVGALVWGYHRRAVAGRAPATREAARLVASVIGLSGAATGIGIVVNSALDTLTPELAGETGRALFLGGLSALLVGAPTWWVAWRPRRTVSPQTAAEPGRRIYLVLIFGLAAVVGLVTLLVIGNRVFEFALGDQSPEGLLDRVRAPLGLLVATGLVATYHFAVWRHDRALAPPAGPERRIHLVVLVTGSDPAPLAAIVHELTGASVTVWLREVPLDQAPDRAGLAQALEGVHGERVLVLCGPAGHVDVVPLAR